MTEAELQAGTEAILRKSGLLWHHCRDVRHCSGPRGFPDLFVAGRGGLLIPELKTEHGDMSSGQRLWRWTLLASGQPWRLYRPADLESGLIHRELSTIRLDPRFAPARLSTAGRGPLSRARVTHE